MFNQIFSKTSKKHESEGRDCYLTSLKNTLVHVIGKIAREIMPLLISNIHANIKSVIIYEFANIYTLRTHTRRLLALLDNKLYILSVLCDFTWNS